MAVTVRGVEVDSYRSLRKIYFPTEQLCVFLGANGVGKTNLYRALQLMQAAAAGSLARELAAEGGMEAVLWTGPRRARVPPRLRFAVSLQGAAEAAPQYRYETQAGFGPSYEIEIGKRLPFAAAFPLEPQIKEERITLQGKRRPVTVFERAGPALTAMDAEGKRVRPTLDLLASETALAALRDAARYPEVELVRQTLLGWRFYHDLRTDPASLIRQPCLAVVTPTLASDGADLAAVFATLVHIREDTIDLDRAIDDAFPGAALHVPMPEQSASFGLRLPEFPHRVFRASELSDGTLRYLALMGVLLGYRLPGFIALNEPEASLHPSLLPPLARLIVQAAQRTQIWLVTHSEILANAIAELGGVTPRVVIKQNGATWIEGLRLVGDFGEADEG